MRQQTGTTEELVTYHFVGDQRRMRATCQIPRLEAQAQVRVYQRSGHAVFVRDDVLDLAYRPMTVTAVHTAAGQVIAVVVETR